MRRRRLRRLCWVGGGTIKIARHPAADPCEGGAELYLQVYAGWINGLLLKWTFN